MDRPVGASKGGNCAQSGERSGNPKCKNEAQEKTGGRREKNNREKKEESASN